MDKNGKSSELNETPQRESFNPGAAGCALIAFLIVVVACVLGVAIEISGGAVVRWF